MNEPNQRDKHLPDILQDLGLDDKDQARLTRPGKGIILPGEDARQLGAKCHDCGSRNVVYYISNPLGQILPAGAYCYTDLLRRCKAFKLVPYPIPQDLLDNLKRDMGLPVTAAPKMMIDF